MTEQQEWCLNCGAAVGTRVVAAPGWRVPIAVAGVLLALAAIAVAVAVVQLADDTDAVTRNPPPAATPVPTATPAVPTPTPTPAAGATTTPDPATAAPATGAPRGDAEWPAGTTGWTVVLASDSSHSDAESKAADFAADGIPGVGVLNADDFSSFAPGTWVVFAGQYDNQEEAAEALDGIDARQAYIRRIVPD